MLLSSVQSIKPGKSKVYVRFVLILYVITVALIVYSAFYFYIKLLLTFFVVIQFRKDWINKAPCPDVYEIKVATNQWVLVTNDGYSKAFEVAIILIHNTLFQLIKLSNPFENKIIILFNDQIPSNQLRTLHLRQLKSSV